MNIAALDRQTGGGLLQPANRRHVLPRGKGATSAQAAPFGGRPRQAGPGRAPRVALESIRAPNGPRSHLQHIEAWDRASDHPFDTHCGLLQQQQLRRGTWRIVDRKAGWTSNNSIRGSFANGYASGGVGCGTGRRRWRGIACGRSSRPDWWREQVGGPRKCSSTAVR